MRSVNRSVIHIDAYLMQSSYIELFYFTNILSDVRDVNMGSRVRRNAPASGKFFCFGHRNRKIRVTPPCSGTWLTPLSDVWQEQRQSTNIKRFYKTECMVKMVMRKNKRVLYHWNHLQIQCEVFSSTRSC